MVITAQRNTFDVYGFRLSSWLAAECLRIAGRDLEKNAAAVLEFARRLSGR